MNARNNKGATPIIIAAVKGNQSVLRLLANNSTIKLNEQVHNKLQHVDRMPLF